MEQQSTLRPGTLLRGGAYRVERALSSGGFGNTYVVKNLNFDETWAMKEFFMKGVNLRDGNTVTVSVPDNRPSFEAQREKFKKEAQRLWHLKNEHIVKVHDLFEENGTAYYVMDFIDGESLSERQKRLGRPLTEKEVEPLLRQALNALEAVHSQNIWHLDIKPANMMVDKQEQLFLIDFGASKQLHSSDGHSVMTSSALAFTPGFAPLEQTYQDFKLFGPWTDLYALGASLYKLLTANTPPSASEIIAMDGKLQFTPNVSPRMQRLITWMMNPAHIRRPQSATDVRQYLDKPIEAKGETTIVDKPKHKLGEDTVRSTPPPTPEQKTVRSQEPSTVRSQEPKAEPQSAYEEPAYEESTPKSHISWGIIVGVILAVIAVLGLGGYLFYGSSSKTVSMQKATTPEYKQPRIVTIPFVSSFGDSGQYTGPIDESGKPNGKGKVVFDNGCRYDGPFLHGVMSGINGIYYFSDGSRFEGTMNADHFYDGTYTATDRSYFRGTFDEKGQPQRGTWYDRNGKKIEDV